MKLLAVSDLHFEFHADHGVSFIDELQKQADVLLVAGDLANTDSLGDALAHLSAAFPQVIFVPGNHDWYRGNRAAMRAVRTQSASLGNVHWLDRDVVELDGQRFVGTTLWFPDTPEARRQTTSLSDFRAIGDFQEWIWEEFERDRQFLQENIRTGDVVVTHHLPTRESVAPRWRNASLNCYFLGNVEDIVEATHAALWVHGHTHDSCDYEFAQTRVLCNPFGYPDAVNPEFSTRMLEVHACAGGPLGK